MSVIFSFALVFVFTRYVVASYVIPTGSMAPTLMGAHMRFWSEQTGFNWAVNPWEYTDFSSRTPRKVQRGPIDVEDPFTGRPIPTMQQTNVPLRIGDRIFVQKYLYSLFEPERWDIVVFKFPGDARENYIKRLAALPGEEVWLVDGDVFTRRPASEDAAEREWSIRRKPDRAQGDLWWTLYSSEYRPLSETIDDRPWRDRWIADGWTGDRREHRWESAGPGFIRWNAAVRPIDDFLPYNDVRTQRQRPPDRYPVSDLRLRADVTPESEGLTALWTIEARDHIFQAVVGPSSAAIRMRPRSRPAHGGDNQWIELERVETSFLAPGRTTGVEFWHVDQALSLWIDGERMLSAEYDWSAEERLRLALRPETRRESIDRIALSSPGMYQPPEVWMSFEGGPVTLRRVGLDRDVHYQPSRIRLNPVRGQIEPGLGTTPDSTIVLGPDEFFVLGDNSGASGDSRAWSTVDPWVGLHFDETAGVVHRELLIGKAFFVFFPAPHKNLGPIPVPDFGRLRLLR